MKSKTSKRLFSVCVMALLGLPVARAQTITIADIRLEGLQRVAASSVFGLLNVNVGDQISQEDIGRIVRDVFASDYFEDIQVLTEENVLIIRVQERPTISEINVEGNKLMAIGVLQALGLNAAELDKAKASWQPLEAAGIMAAQKAAEARAKAAAEKKAKEAADKAKGVNAPK
jgi:outer membrane protein insertion porin family